jgi:hypothetical protein
MWAPVPPSPSFLEHFLEILFCHSVKNSAIRPGSPQWYQTGVLSVAISFMEIRGVRREGDANRLVLHQKMLGEEGLCEAERYRVEATESALTKVRGERLRTLFTQTPAKRRSRICNSQFCLLGTVLRVTTTAI